MNKNLDKHLCDKYPKIFVDRNASEMKSAMHWGFPGNGWFTLLDAMCGSIQSHLNHPMWEPKRGNWIKNLWNRTVWNWIVYPIARFVSFGELPKLRRKTGVVVNNRSQKQWAVYHWFSKWFSCDLKFQPPKNPPKQVVAAQVKEKFAGLRFYADGGDSYTNGVISMAEALSYRICESCGTMDETVAVSGKGWLKTRCEKCVKKSELAHHRSKQDKKLIALIRKARNEKTEE